MGFLAIAASILLILGFLTPVVSFLMCVAATAILLASLDKYPAIQQDRIFIDLCTILLATSVALLGPGAFSLDARMFGRREITIPLNRARSRD